MRDDDLLGIQFFPSMVAAQQAILVLKEAGIIAEVNDSDGAFDLGLDDDPQVEIICMRKHVSRAKEIIAELESAPEESCPAWTCPCGEEVDEGFFVCWSCGNEYSS